MWRRRNNNNATSAQQPHANTNHTQPTISMKQRRIQQHGLKPAGRRGSAASNGPSAMPAQSAASLGQYAFVSSPMLMPASHPNETQLDVFIRQSAVAACAVAPSAPLLPSTAELAKSSSSSWVGQRRPSVTPAVNTSAASSVAPERRFSVGGAGLGSSASNPVLGQARRPVASAAASLGGAASQLQLHLQHRSKSPAARGPRVDGRGLLEEKPVLPFLLVNDPNAKPSPRLYKGPPGGSRRVNVCFVNVPSCAVLHVGGGDVGGGCRGCVAPLVFVCVSFEPGSDIEKI